MRLEIGLTQRQVAERIGGNVTERIIRIRETCDLSLLRIGDWKAHVAALGRPTAEVPTTPDGNR